MLREMNCEWSQVIPWVGPFLGVWTPVLSFRGYTVFAVTIDLPRIDPKFVMATLEGRLDAKYLTIYLECTVHAYLPIGFGTWWLNNPHTSDHSSGTPPGLHKSAGPSRVGRFVFANASSIVLSSPRRTVEVVRDHVNPFLLHSSTDCDWHIFRGSALLGIAVVKVKRHHSEVRLAVAGELFAKSPRDVAA